MINRELAAYDAQLATRPQIVVATKIDALDEPERLERLKLRAAADAQTFLRDLFGDARGRARVDECSVAHTRRDERATRPAVGRDARSSLKLRGREHGEGKSAVISLSRQFFVAFTEN